MLQACADPFRKFSTQRPELSAREKPPADPCTCARFAAMYLNSGWTQIGWSAFSKAYREKKRNNKRCRNRARIQHRGLCFHDSHEKPTTREECKHKSNHHGDTVVLMHADPHELLPVAIDLDVIPQNCSDRVISKKRIPVVSAIRAEKRLGPTHYLLVTDSVVSLSHFPTVTGFSSNNSCKRPRNKTGISLS
jgi:hypothetical protein